jgi:hypothetical protein
LESNATKQITEGLRKVLNIHGYGFHYAVLRKAHDLYENKKSKWVFEAAEFPVTVGGFDTRIDFILRSQDPFDVYWDCFLVAECKRINPALSNWCFVRTPYIRRNHPDRVVMEKIIFSDSHPPVANGEPLFLDRENTYHLGVEVSSGEKGDSRGKGRGQIEEAATQVCKCLNGLIEEFRRHGEGFSKKGPSVLFLPVIFTTAQIWTSEVDIGKAHLQTGNLELKDIDAKKKGWIWLQYHLSPGIKHSVGSYKVPKGLGEVLAQDYIRTIAVVTADGIDEFLGMDLSLWL